MLEYLEQNDLILAQHQNNPNIADKSMTFGNAFIPKCDDHVQKFIAFDVHDAQIS